MKFRTENIHVIPLSYYEFRVTKYSESHTLLKGANKILPIFSVFIVGFVQDLSTIIYWAITGFVKIGAATAILYFGAQINICPYCPHLLPDLSEIWSRRSAFAAIKCTRIS
jgi:hypothetical protein